jgi:hypothetical protein
MIDVLFKRTNEAKAGSRCLKNQKVRIDEWWAAKMPIGVKVTHYPRLPCHLNLYVEPKLDQETNEQNAKSREQFQKGR